MKVTRGLADHKRVPYPVLTIGNFDGQHRGHRALLEAVVRTAAAAGGTPMALTFDPHPVRVLAPAVELRLLTTVEEKLARFQEAGIEEVLFLEFTQELAALEPDEFVSQVLKDGIGVRELFVGEHFAFGRGRVGRAADLVRLGERNGFRVHAVPPFRIDGEVVSSTRIRTLIQTGEVRAAAARLGRFYELEGTVVEGARRGQKMGWPTANLRLPPGRVIPADGVYATVTVWNRQTFDSVSYIGTRPTFGAGERLLEAYLLDQRVDLYGQGIRVQFVERLRGDQTFQNADELSARVDLDVALAREALGARARLTAEG
ncbi:MAG: bifunctional riboflavin kinase/FAD synthetase [Nitrospirota bacterium]